MRVFLLAPLILVLLFLSCVEARFIPIISEPYPPKPKNEPIMIILPPYRQSFEYTEIGTLKVFATDKELRMSDHTTTEDFLRALVKKARAVGADALIELNFGYLLYYDLTPEHGGAGPVAYVSAIAVKVKEK